MAMFSTKKMCDFEESQNYNDLFSSPEKSNAALRTAVYYGIPSVISIVMILASIFSLIGKTDAFTMTDIPIGSAASNSTRLELCELLEQNFDIAAQTELDIGLIPNAEYCIDLYDEAKLKKLKIQKRRLAIFPA